MKQNFEINHQPLIYHYSEIIWSHEWFITIPKKVMFVTVVLMYQHFFKSVSMKHRL